MDAHEPHDARPLPDGPSPVGDPRPEVAVHEASGGAEWSSAPAIQSEGSAEGVESETRGDPDDSADQGEVQPEQRAEGAESEARDERTDSAEHDEASVQPERAEREVEGAEAPSDSENRSDSAEPGDADALTLRQAQGERDSGSESAEAQPEPVRRKSHVAPALIPLDRLDDDATFRIRPEGDLSLLATDIARLGQLFPVDLRLIPPHRFQVVCGFRRVAALRFLKRDKVLARLHTDLSDEDALLMALASAIHGTQVSREALESARDRLETAGRLSSAAKDMLEKALEGDALAPESPYEEIDADELAVDVTTRLGAINQDLALLADVFSSLEPGRRAELLQQLQYSAELVAFLEGR